MRIAAWAAVWLAVVIGWASPSWSAPPGWLASLTIATASPGGVYLVYGQALAAVLTEALGMPVEAQATQGTDQNILLIDSGDAQLGFVTTGTALQAWNGSGAWTHGKQLRSMRALFPMYDTPLHFLALKSSGIGSIQDMADKRVGAGPQGGTAGTYAQKIFDTLGISTVVRFGAWSTLSTQIRSGLLDALVGAAGIPFPVVAELDRTGDIRFVPLGADEIAELRKAMPELSSSVVPAVSYPSLKTDYKTIGLYNFGVGSKDLPDDLVYAIVTAFYANHDRMVKAVPAARESVVGNLGRNTFIPYHPGAVRYYREIGVEIPADLVAGN
jgi:TRAP transporter TAXI family solute receptor